MGKLRPLLLAASLAWPSPAPAQTVAQWRPHIDEASARFDVPTAWIEAVMRAESGGRTHLDGRPIRSSAGAMGLMQLMPGTWAQMRARLGLGSNPDEPRDNILAGTYYLRLMYERFGYPGLFGAYNAGPARYAAYLAGRHALPSETVHYLASVTGRAPRVAVQHAPSPRKSAPPGLFAIRKEGAGEAASEPARQSMPSLFVVLSRGQ